jgi:maltose alpha-D-glucosyltransferase/alpha-amylase
MEKLGQRLGELHRALAVPTGDEQFDPEPVTAAEVKAWVSQVRQEALSTIWELHDRRTKLTIPVGALAEELRGHRGILVKRIDAAGRGAARFVKTRYHGDLHLGQVLLAENDFVITDFEGEPARPLAERRIKHCVLRDVAGMLRSFSYAAFSALRRVTADRPGDWDALKPLAIAWERCACEAFLRGYGGAMEGVPSYPDDPEYAQRLIDVFVVEKLMYEIRYELNNRPLWVEIPLLGLEEMLVRLEATRQ